LASRVLAASCRELPGQWEERFDYRPLLAESFTDPEGYSGTCDKASGWEPVGHTGGNSRHRADYYIANHRPKRLWMKELEPGARAKALATPLAAEHATPLVAPVAGLLPITPRQRRSLLETLRRAPDPRAKNTRFRIGPVLAIVVMALLCGARQISEIARFANRLSQRQRAELGLPLKKGTRAFRQVPSYDVFYEVLTRMDPEAFAAPVERLAGRGARGAARHARPRRKNDPRHRRHRQPCRCRGRSPVGLAVMDQKEGGERCELKAAQQLLEAIPQLDGCTVTADALHCQKQTARLIAQKGGEYLLQIKANQPDLLAYARSRPESRTPSLPKPAQDTAASKSARFGLAKPTQWAPASTAPDPSSISAAPARSKRADAPAPRTATTSRAKTPASAAPKLGST